MKPDFKARRVGADVLMDEPTIAAFIDTDTITAHPEWEGGSYGS